MERENASVFLRGVGNMGSPGERGDVGIAPYGGVRRWLLQDRGGALYAD